MQKKPVWLLSLLFSIITISPSINALTFFVGGGLGSGKFSDYCATESIGCDKNGKVLQVVGGFRFYDDYELQGNVTYMKGLKTPYKDYDTWDGTTEAFIANANILRFISLNKTLSMYGGFSVGVSSIDEKLRVKAISMEDLAHKDDGHEDDPYWRKTDDERFKSRSASGMAGWLGLGSSVTSGGLLGLEIAITKDISARIQWQRCNSVDGNDAYAGRSNLDLFSTNLVWVF